MSHQALLFGLGANGKQIGVSADVQQGAVCVASSSYGLEVHVIISVCVQFLTEHMHAREVKETVRGSLSFWEGILYPPPPSPAFASL